jgi:hypothetical protein
VISTTPLGLENPQPAGYELVNGEIACPETASPSSISFDVDIPAGASFIQFDYAFADADEGDYGAVFLDIPAAVSGRTGPNVLQGSAARNTGPSASPIAVLSASSAPPGSDFQSSGLIPLSTSQTARKGHDDDVQLSGRSGRLYVSPSAFPHRIRMSGKMFRQACHDLRH